MDGSEWVYEYGSESDDWEFGGFDEWYIYGKTYIEWVYESSQFSECDDRFDADDTDCKQQFTGMQRECYFVEQFGGSIGHELCVDGSEWIYECISESIDFEFDDGDEWELYGSSCIG